MNMKFNAEQYFAASMERMKQAKLLYDNPKRDCYAISIYVAGVAIECMLRAFKLKHDPTFDERHNLKELLTGSRMLQIDEDALATEKQGVKYRRTLSAIVNEICELWGNEYRYASEDRLRSEFNRKKLYKDSKGYILKSCACRMINAAGQFYERGVILWQRLKKK